MMSTPKKKGCSSSSYQRQEGDANEWRQLFRGIYTPPHHPFANEDDRLFPNLYTTPPSTSHDLNPGHLFPIQNGDEQANLFRGIFTPPRPQTHPSDTTQEEQPQLSQDSYNDADPMFDPRWSPNWKRGNPLVPYDSSSEDDDNEEEVTPTLTAPQQIGGGPVRAAMVDRARFQDPVNRQRGRELPLPIGQYFDLDGPVTRRVVRFGIEGQAYTIRFRNYAQMVDLERILIGAFRQAILRAFVNANPTDMVGVQIRHPGLHNLTYNIPFGPRYQVTPERIYAVLEKLVQSGAEIDVSDDLTIVFTRVADVRGGRPGQRIWDHKTWMRKHCKAFITVEGDDDLCLARALVVAEARAEMQAGNAARFWNTFRKVDRRCKRKESQQKKAAKKLMEDCGLKDHRGQCGLQELQRFQDFFTLRGYQIKVFSAQAMNAMVFRGPEAAKVLYLYHDRDDDTPADSGGHFSVCTKPHVIFNTSYFCDVCNRGFNDKNQHRCIKKCYSCHRLKECERVGEWKQCEDCKRWFRSQACFDYHKTVTPNDDDDDDDPTTDTADKRRRRRNKRPRIMTTCQRYRWCDKCEHLLDYARIKTKLNGIPHHICGTTYCIRCWMTHPIGEK